MSEMQNPLAPSPAAERLAALPAFGPGVQLMTPEGEIPVEWLATGDRLLTRDHGAQPILWLGRMRIGRERLAHAPELAPVEIAAGALGFDMPTHTTRLAPHSRVLLSGAAVALHAGTDEALAEISDLDDGAVVTRPPLVEGVHYTAVLLPQHEVVQANGLWVETLLLDRPTLRALEGELPRPLASSARLRQGHATAARMFLAEWEVAAMRGTEAAEAMTSLIRWVA